MPSLTEKKILPYSAKQIYSLVMDIEKYPEFLPWCKQAKIIEVKSDENLIADLLINFKNFFEKYRSDVKHGIDENGDYFVDVVAIEGPFKHLTNKWKFKKIQNNHSPALINPSPQPSPPRGEGDDWYCEIEFFIEFQFNSFILEKMLGGIFEKATHKMMLAFEERAKVVFI